MEWFLLISCVYLISFAKSMDSLKLRFEWKSLDFEYESEEKRLEAINSGAFKPENCNPLGLEVHGERLFITVPRWKDSVPASLTYINISDPEKSPKLRPYPNWAAHDFRPHQTPEIVSPMRIRADRCGRLWVLDSGIVNSTGTKPENLTAPALLIYDLTTDRLWRKYVLPHEQTKGPDSLFANVVVEDTDCDDTFAYLADIVPEAETKPAIVVYSLKNDSSWRIQHNYFFMDPMSAVFTISNSANLFSYRLSEGVLGLALSKPDEDGFSTLYFHALASTDEFYVNTKYLRDPNAAKDLSNEGKNFHEIKRLGNRREKGQSGASFLHQKSDVLFYTLPNLNAVACWRTTNPYEITSHSGVIMNNVTMVYPSDVKVDADDNLWVLSDRLPIFLFTKESLDYDDVNFRIFTAKVTDAIEGSSCDNKLIIPAKANKNKSDDNSGGFSGKATFGGSYVIALCVAVKYYF